MGTVGSSPCRRISQSLWLDCVLQCLLMFIDWEECGNHGVPSLQEDNAGSLVWLCSTVFADVCRLDGVRAPWVPLPARGRLSGPSVMQTVGWLRLHFYSFLSHCTLQTAPRSDNSHLSNEDCLNSMAVVKNPEPLSGLRTFSQGSLFQTRLTLHANEEPSWLPLSLSPTIELLPMPQS